MEALELKTRAPYLFNTISQAQSAEKEAEPLQLKTARAEAEAQAKHDEAAQPGAQF